ncbi:hypothetical protein F5148DRAFT_459820 [Russula earlei]|uniref:Uncharacterized protein n=1 Tax=Russula earlei TaxID=71964 RepID=A0ACC0U062_9AGAM|nr:hypothetical protein F5148DRAFT_459820 [Russula earlei]
MVKWSNRETILHQLEALVKVVHFMTGVYIWEFFSKLNFEWSIIRQRRRRGWTAALYMACRVTTLAAAVTHMTGFNMTSPISCKTWLVFVRIFANTSTTLALTLYGLRSIAIWQRNSYLLVFLVACLITNVVLWLRLTVRPDVEWNEETRTCLVMKVSRGLPNNVSMLIIDVILFVITLSGVFRRNSGKDLNDVMNLMFQTPAIVFSGIGATRMYRQILDRQEGDLLEYLESSRDATTGEIRFRRQTQLISRPTRSADPCVMSGVVATNRLGLNEGDVEPFEACGIRVERPGCEAHIDPDWVL